MDVRWLALILAPLILSACVFAAGEDRPAPVRPGSAGPITLNGPTPRETQQCFTDLVRYGVAPAAYQILGSELVRVESFGTYACRGIIGAGDEAAKRVSEHGLGNAVDISAFVLRDGRRISILNDWRSNDPAVRRFLQTVHKSACKRFRTVLSPDYNAAHQNHLHLDMGRGPFCA